MAGPCPSGENLGGGVEKKGILVGDVGRGNRGESRFLGTESPSKESHRRHKKKCSFLSSLGNLGMAGHQAALPKVGPGTFLDHAESGDHHRHDGTPLCEAFPSGCQNLSPLPDNGDGHMGPDIRDHERQRFGLHPGRGDHQADSPSFRGSCPANDLETYDHFFSQHGGGSDRSFPFQNHSGLAYPSFSFCNGSGFYQCFLGLSSFGHFGNQISGYSPDGLECRPNPLFSNACHVDGQYDPEQTMDS